MTRRFAGLIALTASIVLACAADAQPPVDFNDPKNPPACLKGTEQLSPTSKTTDVMFLIRGNVVRMHDFSPKPIDGTGTVTGANRLTFTFKNCVYEGFLVESELSGTARWTEGPDQGKTWNFRVYHVEYPPK
jgi:hypothetical protein